MADKKPGQSKVMITMTEEQRADLNAAVDYFSELYWPAKHSMTSVILLAMTEYFNSHVPADRRVIKATAQPKLF